MHLALNEMLPISVATEATYLKALKMECLLEELPSVLKTPANLTLLNIYFLIPQHSIRCFVLLLLARIAGDITTYPGDDLSEVEYLLTHYSRLPTKNMQDKVLTLVRQVCAANGGDVNNLYEEGSAFRSYW